MKGLRRTLCVVVFAVALGIVLPALPSVAAPSKAAYPPRAGCALAVSDHNLVPGQAVRVTGSGLPADTVVDVSMDVSPTFDLGSARTTRDGDLNVVSVLPETLPAGKHTVHVSHAVGCAGVVTDVAFSVDGVGASAAGNPVSAQAGPTSARTRIDTWPGGLVVLVVLCLVVYLVVSLRTRRRRTTP